MSKKIIDLRSDTITMPTFEMRQAMFDCEVGDDVLGEDTSVNELESLAARLLEKEAAMFVPSGTFANQCAIMTHTRPGNEIVLSETSHIVQHEAGASALLSGVQLRQITPKNGAYLQADEIKSRLRLEDDIHYPDSGLICLEQATAFGEVYPLLDMQAIYQLARIVNVPVHIDGARLFNAAISLGCDAAELACFADSVSICLSKGLCSPVGSLLLGQSDFIKRARHNRKIMGGGMRQAGVLAACGSISLTKMVDRLSEDHKHASRLSEMLGNIDGLKISRKSNINMVFVKTETQGFTTDDFARELGKKSVLVYAPEDGELRFVTHFDIDNDDIEQVYKIAKKIMSSI